MRASVRDGLVALDGTVDWNFQWQAASGIVEHIAGVVGVVDNIVLRPVTSSPDVHPRIASALRRSADINASRIHVTADVGHVNFTGSLSSLAERERALQAVWSAPGVTRVSDEFVIR